jgi:DNA invertase Pin-like site-specific DNA recombinase
VAGALGKRPQVPLLPIAGLIICRNPAVNRHLSHLNPFANPYRETLIFLRFFHLNATFERDLIRERLKSGLAAARAKGKKLGRQAGQRPSDKKATKVLDMAGQGLRYRLIGRNLGMSKNTVYKL